MDAQPKKANYGIDAPYMGLVLVLTVITLPITAFFLRTTNSEVAPSIASILFSITPTSLILLVLIGIYIKVEKFRLRDRLLGMVVWTGDEQVLDIGTGKGLLLIGAA